MGDIIVNPKFFDRNSLYIKTHLGGHKPEIHKYTEGMDAEHGKAWSTLISSQHCLGVTEGVLELGDYKTALIITQPENSCHAPAMVTCLDIDDSYIFRVQFSAREIDDTSSSHVIKLGPEGRNYKFTITMADL
jgi:hypothetical protein